MAVLVPRGRHLDATGVGCGARDPLDPPARCRSPLRVSHDVRRPHRSTPIRPRRRRRRAARALLHSGRRLVLCPGVGRRPRRNDPTAPGGLRRRTRASRRVLRRLGRRFSLARVDHRPRHRLPALGEASPNAALAGDRLRSRRRSIPVDLPDPLAGVPMARGRLPARGHALVSSRRGALRPALSHPRPPVSDGGQCRSPR